MLLQILAELAQEAGLPAGVLNVIHGAKDSVNFICDDPTIKAISFVGSGAVGHHIFARWVWGLGAGPSGLVVWWGIGGIRW